MVKKVSKITTIERNEPNPVDKHVGSRIRLRRNILHLTQQQMADLLGLTFQQVQKYEKGLNRVGASRLWDISRVLEVPMDFFFEDMAKEVATQSPRMLKADEKCIMAEEQRQYNSDPMSKKETLELIRAYYKIPNRKLAKELFDLIVELSKSTVMLQTDKEV